MVIGYLSICFFFPISHGSPEQFPKKREKVSNLLFIRKKYICGISAWKIFVAMVFRVHSTKERAKPFLKRHFSTLFTSQKRAWILCIFLTVKPCSRHSIVQIMDHEREKLLPLWVVCRYAIETLVFYAPSYCISLQLQLFSCLVKARILVMLLYHAPSIR